MAKVRVRKETGLLYLDFNYRGVRCREQTALTDTPQNRKDAEKLLKVVMAKIELGQFVYREHFPSSTKADQFDSMPDFEPKPLAKAQSRAGKPAVPAFHQFANQWFDEIRVQWRASHEKNVRNMLDSVLIPYFGKMPLDGITKADLMAFRAEEASRPGRGDNQTLCAKSINNRMGLLRMIFEEASDRYAFDNPYRNIKPLRLRKTHVEPFSLIDVNRILETVRPDYRNYYSIRFFTGMRSGEVHGLKWVHIDFDKRLILVRETLIDGRTEYTKNNGSQREIPMLGPVYDALLDQYRRTHHLSDYVFCSTTGQPLDQNNITKRIWYPLLKYLGLKKRRPYQTRHTTATLLLAAGENPEWVARLLGHSSTEMLFKVYSRYIPNLTRQDGSAFNNFVSMGPETEGDNDE